ncbi:hypothetical protein TNCT_276071 [Trichonephila clavata]|uniref:Uncharacterized protein n=1 Tax=Trichonephila clavata TaxID=2740835 RepID=A0A8X6HKI7_TRICU|nr:hypothetical protein TNCT_276071 [Trichonephila clavata]
MVRNDYGNRKSENQRIRTDYGNRGTGNRLARNDHANRGSRKRLMKFSCPQPSLARLAHTCSLARTCSFRACALYLYHIAVVWKSSRTLLLCSCLGIDMILKLCYSKMKAILITTLSRTFLVAIVGRLVFIGF